MEETLTTLLAGVAGGRRYWVRAPQRAGRPFLVLNVISAPRDYHMTGASDPVAYRVQVDAYGATYQAAKDTARAVIGILSGYRGGRIQGAFLAAERDMPAADAGEVNVLFRTSLEFMIHYQEN